MKAQISENDHQQTLSTSQTNLRELSKIVFSLLDKQTQTRDQVYSEIALEL